MERSRYSQSFIHFERAPEIIGIQYFDPIVRAIENSMVLRITYLPYYEDKPYFNEVHPYLLKEFRHRWYLIGFNAYREQLRTYALDRIRSLEELKTKEFKKILEKLFGEQFRDSFRRNPIKVFEKLPEEQQTIIARMATQSRFSNDGGN